MNVTKITQAYGEKKINFGGEMKTRAEIIATMMKEGHSRQNTDRYLQGADRLANPHLAGTRDHQVQAPRRRDIADAVLVQSD